MAKLVELRLSDLEADYLAGLLQNPSPIAQEINTKLRTAMHSPDNLKIRVGNIFNRRIATKWLPKEERALKALNISEDDLSLMERYYAKSGCKYLRKELYTLLNNWAGELDKAQRWADEQAATGKYF